jgi:hypothetical protein
MGVWILVFEFILVYFQIWAHFGLLFWLREFEFCSLEIITHVHSVRISWTGHENVLLATNNKRIAYRNLATRDGLPIRFSSPQQQRWQQRDGRVWRPVGQVPRTEDSVQRRVVPDLGQHVVAFAHFWTRQRRQSTEEQSLLLAGRLLFPKRVENRRSSRGHSWWVE